MKDSVDFKPHVTAADSPKFQFTKEQLIASSPPELRAPLTHAHINELFDKKYMTDSFLHQSINAGIHQNLSDVDMLKNIVIALLDDREVLLDEKFKRIRALTTPNVVGLSHQSRSKP